MKKVISLLTVTVRSTIYKIILILIGMSGLQLGMFYHAYQKFDFSENNFSENYVITGKEMLGQAYGVSWTLESLVEESNISIVFLSAFALIGLVLFWAEGERKGSNTFYFYDRLVVSKKQRISSLTLYNMACVIMLVFAEVLTVMGLGAIFKYLIPAEYESVQMYFMAFYKSEFLHCLLPLADVFKWIRNILIFTAAALEIAVCACKKRRTWSVFMIVAMIIFGFVQEIGTFGAMDIIMILTAGVCIGIDVYQVWFGGQADDI